MKSNILLILQSFQCPLITPKYGIGLNIMLIPYTIDQIWINL